MAELAKPTGTSGSVLRWGETVALISVVVIVFGAGVLVKMRSLPYATGTDSYLVAAYRELSYSDIIALYLRTLERSEGHRPYFDEGFEYPVVVGGLHYLGILTGEVGRSFALQAGVLALAAGSVALALSRLPGARPAQFALTPALMLYGTMNWDLLAIAPLAWAMVAIHQGRSGRTGLLLGLGTWTKLFPIALLPALLGLLATKPLPVGRRVIGAFGLVTLLLNLPIIGLDPSGWASFLTFGAGREAHSTLWNLLGVPGALVNPLGVVVVGLGALWVFLVVRANPDRWIEGGAFLLTWWLIWNKAASPQYSLYVVFLLAALGAPWRFQLLEGVLGIAYFLTSFQSLVLWNEQQLEQLSTYQLWFVHPIVVGRILLLAGFATWIAIRSVRPRSCLRSAL